MSRYFVTFGLLGVVVLWLVLSYAPAPLPQIAVTGATLVAWLPPLAAIVLAVFALIQLDLLRATVRMLKQPGRRCRARGRGVVQPAPRSRSAADRDAAGWYTAARPAFAGDLGPSARTLRAALQVFVLVCEMMRKQCQVFAHCVVWSVS
jgi:hypothetical protein